MPTIYDNIVIASMNRLVHSALTNLDAAKTQQEKNAAIAHAIKCCEEYREKSQQKVTW